MKLRKSNILPRKTSETQISVSLSLDGRGQSKVETGIGIMDHMLTLLAKHSRFDLTMDCKGDLNVDMHHSVEDLGICLGQALLDALGDKKGIRRFGFFYMAMDEALARVVIDLGGRPYLVFNGNIPPDQSAAFDYSLAYDFFKAFTDNARLNLHIDLLSGRNSHHCLEAIFKALAMALRQACELTASGDLPTTKGIL